MANWSVCEICGEADVDLDITSDGVCEVCAGGSTFLESTVDFFGFVGGTSDIMDDVGYRSCNCEDFPCCGH